MVVQPMTMPFQQQMLPYRPQQPAALPIQRMQPFTNFRQPNPQFNRNPFATGYTPRPSVYSRSDGVSAQDLDHLVTKMETLWNTSNALNDCQYLPNIDIETPKRQISASKLDSRQRAWSGQMPEIDWPLFPKPLAFTHRPRMCQESSLERSSIAIEKTTIFIRSIFCIRDGKSGS